MVHADLLTCSVFERKDHDVFDSDSHSLLKIANFFSNCFAHMGTCSLFLHNGEIPG